LKQNTTDNAKSLISIIGKEYALGLKRVEDGFVKPDRMLGTVLERLNRMACNNINLRLFLDNIGHIPEEEDESLDVPWAEDPREARENDVRTASSYLRTNRNKVGEKRKRYGDRNCDNVLTKAL
jgi:hypothetical protein